MKYHLCTFSMVNLIPFEEMIFSIINHECDFNLIQVGNLYLKSPNLRRNYSLEKY